jgi:hypothetical protein
MQRESGKDLLFISYKNIFDTVGGGSILAKI